METGEVFPLILCIGGGIFAILASIFDWDFFFENRKARLFISLFGRKGSRIFYSVLGVLLFVLAYKILAK